MTRNNHAAATTFVRLHEENLTVPRPGWLYMLWRGSHPALGERIDFANRYRPWEKEGKDGKDGKDGKEGGRTEGEDGRTGNRYITQ
jgi:hypothetical protein